MSCFCCTGKGTSNTHQKVPLVTVASELWAVAFRANFLVFWAHCMSKSLRASRLDAVQHRAIHGLNSATKLTLRDLKSSSCRRRGVHSGTWPDC